MEQSIINALNQISNRLLNNKIAVGFEQLTVSNSAISLQNIVTSATSCTFTVDTNKVVFKEFGIPTPTEGHNCSVGSVVEINTQQNIQNLKLIAAGADGVINVTYYK